MFLNCYSAQFGIYLYLSGADVFDKLTEERCGNRLILLRRIRLSRREIMKNVIGITAVLTLSVSMLVGCGGDKNTDTDGADKGEMAGQVRKC